jgi:hypothetical protein
MMDIEQNREGQWHFSLGPLERWIVGLASVAMIGMFVFIFNSFSTRLDRYGDSQDKQLEAQRVMATQLAVMSGQMTTLNTQLADVPGLNTRTTKLETNQAELIRRVGRIEDGASSKMKGWTR